MVELDDEGRLEPNTRVHLQFAKTRMTGTWKSTPSCVIENTTIVLPGGVSLQLEHITDSLSRHPFQWTDLEDDLGVGPEDFIHRGWFARDPQGKRVALALSRRYAVATVDTAFGLVTRDDGSVQVLSIVPGPIDHLAWAPDGRHLAMAWTRSAKGRTGVTGVHVYDIKEGHRLLTLLELLLGPIADISWSLESHVLQVEVLEVDGETISWLPDTGEESATRHPSR